MANFYPSRFCEYCNIWFVPHRINSGQRYCSNRCAGFSKPHQVRIPLMKRFESKVDRTPGYGPWGDCHLWVGAINSKGYGSIFNSAEKDAPSTRLAHVIAYETIHGPVPDGLQLDHLCRIRDCVNVSHLEAVTATINVRRGLVPLVNGEQERRKTHCPSGHEYDAENTYIDVLRNKRRCRICNKLRGRLLRASKVLSN